MASETQIEAGAAHVPNKGIKRITSAFNGRLLYSCSLIALSQVNFGMDQAAFNNTQAMSAFNKKFGHLDEARGIYVIETYFLSFLNSFTYMGFMFGLITGSMISNRFGRKKCIVVMACWALVAATVLVTSQVREQMLVGRILAYIYIGMELSLVPVLQSELVPAEVRGFVVGTYQTGLITGQLIMSLICRGTSTIPGDSSWRIPLGLFYVIPTILLLGVYWMPESPRWLLIRNRHTEALASLRLLRRGRFTDDQITAEFHHLQLTLDATVEAGRFRELFQGTNLKRTLIVVGVNIFLQLTGQNFVSLYGAIFIRDLNTINPFTMTSINSGLSILVLLITQSLTDVVGRVPLMLVGSIIQSAAVFTMGGLGTVPSSPAAPMPIRQGITAMVTIFTLAFSLGWAPLSHAVAAEIPTQRLRDKTYAFGSVFNIAVQFAISFSTPYLLNPGYANLQSKVGFIFGTTAAMASVFTWVCVPECKGRTLEEVDRLFLEGVPVRRFRGWELEPLHGEGLGGGKGGGKEGAGERVEEVA